MQYNELKKRLEAAEDLLNDKKTTFEKFKALQNLLKGISGKIDLNLGACAKELTKLEHMHKGEVIELVLEELPAVTEEEKKRKKLLLLFNTHWKEIKSEVKRIKSELSHVKDDGNTAQAKAKGIGRIVGFAKGPVGLITVIAAGIVVLQSISVNILVKNIGCASLTLVTSPFPIPGMVLPREPIPDGGSATVKLPPLTVGVDNTASGNLKITILGLTKSFDFPASDIVFDGSSLSNKNSSINLGEKKEHELRVICN